MSGKDVVEGAGLLRRVLNAVDAGELDVKSPTAAAIRRRLEGAIIAAEIAAGLGRKLPSHHDEIGT